ncbi:heavy-metal-associated domain-containing protein [Micrococcoides hystricis]|uniref:Heavy-metal-associated domain-containing protein n=1 Tax=Micrococcoides hystricis TaxID=1572761 RepID=A0ABV6PA74_9MICC
MSYTKDFAVTGMTCKHCIMSVEEEVSEVPAVTNVAVDLVSGGTSTVTVTADEPIDDQAVAAAIDEAGFSLAN